MDYRSLLIGVPLTLAASLSIAGYADLKPPAGVSVTSGGVVNIDVAKAAHANAAKVAAGKATINTTLNIGGRVVNFPVSAKMAANAPRIAAGLIFNHPALRLGMGIATLLGGAGLVYDAVNNIWTAPNDLSDYPVSDGYYYIAGTTVGTSSDKHLTPEAAIADFISKNTSAYVTFSISTDCSGGYQTYQGQCLKRHYKGSAGDKYGLYVQRQGASSCPAGWYVTPAGCLQTPPPKQVNEEEFWEKFKPNADEPLDDDVWPEIPHPLPVETPEVVPTFVPTGNPVPNPNYDPNKAPSPENQPYHQPGVKVEPAPTPQNPFQVSVNPVNRPVSNPNANPDPVPEPKPDPGTQPDPNKPKDEAKEPGLCEQFPGIIACEKLEEPEEVKLPEIEAEFNFKPESGFFDNRVCPAPIQATVGGQTLSFSWQPLCDQLDLIKPLMLALAWLTAAFIFLGAKSE